MTKRFTARLSLVLAACGALSLSSCLDPYYGGGVSYGGGVGYGDGFGYGNPGFSTSVFVSTGNSRWGYDPVSYCYYDYWSRRFYDPYMFGYYPVGYRPPVLYGVPHPRGYRRGFCPPPGRINNVILNGYRDRERLYRSSHNSWAPSVRMRNNGNPQYGNPRNFAPQRTQYDNRVMPQNSRSFQNPGHSRGWRGVSAAPGAQPFFQNPGRGGYQRQNAGFPVTSGMPVRQIGSVPDRGAFPQRGSFGGSRQIPAERQYQPRPMPSQQAVQRAAPQAVERVAPQAVERVAPPQPVAPPTPPAGGGAPPVRDGGRFRGHEGGR